MQSKVMKVSSNACLERIVFMIPRLLVLAMPVCTQLQRLPNALLKRGILNL
jgi:hypothetical protein